jgi:hypothetical protein
MALGSWIRDVAPLLCNGLQPPLAAGGGLCFFPSQKDEPEPPRLPDPRRTALLGLIVTLLLVVLGVLLVRVLGRAARLQDCVLSGRTDCAPIDAPIASSR